MNGNATRSAPAPTGSTSRSPGRIAPRPCTPHTILDAQTTGDRRIQNVTGERQGSSNGDPLGPVVLDGGAPQGVPFEIDHSTAQAPGFMFLEHLAAGRPRRAAVPLGHRRHRRATRS